MPVLTLPEALLLRRSYADTGRTVVFTNGHFDLLHVGHLHYLQAARKLGDALIVGVNGDDSTRRLKGEGRPLIPADERAQLLDALKPVSAVVIFEEDTADSVIELLRPDIYVKGGDYHDKHLPERALVENLGGKVVLIDLVPERSTSALIEKIRALPLTPNRSTSVSGKPDTAVGTPYMASVPQDSDTESEPHGSKSPSPPEGEGDLGGEG